MRGSNLGERLFPALTGCARNTGALRAVGGFELKRYLGLWYEIARLPHWFERGLTHTTARYALQADGRVSVANRGYSPEKGKWVEALAVAWLAGEPGVGHLRVRFVWPFWSTYKVIALDPEYQWSVVAGGDFTYLWILGREPSLAPEVLDGLLAKAREFGFDTARLEFPEQRDPPK
ncbi:MAG TPA: lipocalin family protein [Candidatus Brocadiia bacterium]|nr:lipocalin family protein [Candidatus Brocadiia bacterium]